MAALSAIYTISLLQKTDKVSGEDIFEIYEIYSVITCAFTHVPSLGVGHLTKLDAISAPVPISTSSLPLKFFVFLTTLVNTGHGTDAN